MVGYGEVYYGVHEAGVNYPLGVGSGAYRVSIQKKAYVGSATALLIAAHSQILKQEPEKKQKFFKYCSTSLSFEFVEQEALSMQEFYTEDDREWCLEYTKDGNLIYRGWIFGQNIKERYTNAEYTFEITATDGLKELDKIPFVDTDGFPFTSKLTGLEVLKHINRLLGLDLPMSTVLSVYEISQTQTDTDDVLAVLKIDQQRFLDENGAARTCKYVLSNLCILLSANFFQNDGVLCFERYTAEAEGKTKRINYDKDGAYLSNTSLVATYEVSKDTSHAAIFPTVEVDIEPALEEVTVDYSYKAGSYLVPNSGFDKVSFDGGSATTTITLSAVDGYSYTKKTLANYAGWTAFGGVGISQIELNEAAISKMNEAAKFFGYAKPTYLRISKLTADGGLISAPSYIRKDSTIGFKAGSNYLLNNIGGCKISVKLTSDSGIVKWFNHLDNDWSDTERKIQSTLQPLLTNPSVSFAQKRNYYKVEASKPVPFDGYIQVLVYNNEATVESDIEIFDMKLLTSTALAIETESHTANNIKKYTKIADKEEVSFSDEAMGYLPSTLWKGDRIAGSFVKKAVFLPYKLIDLAVETVFEQYHRPSMVVYLDYLGVKLNIGQRATFGSSVFPKLAGRTWKITDNRSYCFETMMGSCTMHEVFTDFAEYDRNNQVLDKDGKTIHIVSDRITGTTSNTITPWTWSNIGGATGSATRFPTNPPIYFTTSDSDDIWTTADNFGYLWQTGAYKTLEGIVDFPEGLAMDAFSKAGLMIRQSLDANSKQVSIVKQKNGWLTVLVRSETGGATNVVANIQNLASIGKLQLKQLNNNTVVVGYWNGVSFTEVANVAITFSDPAYFGFCFASKGVQATFAVREAVLSGGITQLKPLNLVSQQIITKAATTVGPPQPVEKPTGLTSQTIITKAEGQSTTGGGGDIPPNTNVPLNSWGGVRTIADRGLIKDSRRPSAQYEYSPQGQIIGTNVDINVTLLRQGLLHDNNWPNLKGKAYKKWKTTGDFEDVPLQNYAISDFFTGKQISLTIYYFNQSGIIQEEYQEIIQL